jgi:Cytidylate kinase-like family
VAVVTLSRQYGAGGLRAGPALAEALGFTFVDREIVEEAARRLGIQPEVAEERDERAPAIVEEIGLALAAASPELGIAAVPELDDRSLAEATRRVILSLAETGGFVILGRGSQAALAGRKDACHIALVGDLSDRIQRIMEWQNVSEREARSRCERFDAERAGYVKHFYGRDIRDPLLYDCVLNTSRLGLEASTEMAVAAARRKFGLA